MAHLNRLVGACACERNYYNITFPPESASLAQVFFDNSNSSRRATAAPVTAWLRVPLDWYSSATFAHFPDESHASIKRTFHTPTSNRILAPTRRQFCGYCGTTLTAYNEAQQARGYSGRDDTLDVTLSSLLNESLARLESLKILPDNDSDQDSVRSQTEDLVKGGSVDDEDHIPTNEDRPGGVDAPPTGATTVPVRTSQQRAAAPHRMHSRGVPYFEEMIEHSRLGRIKRQRGGEISRDGTSSVQWEIVEIGGEEPTPNATATEPSGSKRQRLDI
ncbi:uncharacterized protein MYCFIDRAFT_203430 [Pseudocercospora fijiensis CIRAD86]|uniref:CENP-V/GFA domain-containing protein n=1 Tax=Pseudocercospora fijiensis (strain CIRAD86) TaxID=383855 RepID=M3B0B5_PSEFD|nr:uncharacterized protein MYCFIDRAFT_203430 [Pseudocercospora fijiensis CIRAD86]EME82872.1 hypothetical protein MYCFIDRAFT_203430 [Pseudocercospora fijiensis CIRAD86]